MSDKTGTVENNDRQCDNYEGLTFKQIFDFLKKSAPRILLFAVVAVLIAVIICGGVFFITREKNVQGVIDFAYEGVERGLDPLGGTFESESIKAPSVLAAAVKSLGYSTDITKLRNSITISGVTPKDVMDQIEIVKEIATKDPTALQQLEELKYYPNKYIVTINNFDDLGLSSNEANALLNRIFDQYKADFKDIYGNVTLVSSALKPLDFSTRESEGFNYDYLEICNIFRNELDNYIAYFDEMGTSAGQYRGASTLVSFGDLKEMFVSIETTDLANLENFITTKSVTKNKELALSNIEHKIGNLEIQKAKVETQITDMKLLIDAYKQGTVVVPVGDGSTHEYNLASANYDKLVNDLAALYKSKSEIESNITTYTKQRTDIEAHAGASDEQDRETAADMIIRLHKKVGAMLDVGERTIIEYRETKLLSDAIYTLNTGVVSESPMSIMMTIGITAVSVVVAACAAMLVENNKMKKAANNG